MLSVASRMIGISTPLAISSSVRDIERHHRSSLDGEFVAMAPVIEAAVRIPLLHIADPTAAAIHEAHLSAVDLPGTLCKLTPRGDLAPSALNSILKQSGLKK